VSSASCIVALVGLRLDLPGATTAGVLCGIALSAVALSDSDAARARRSAAPRPPRARWR
jgi:hypothetical protein